MTERDPVLELLRRADAAAPRPPERPGLALAVRRASQAGERRFRVVAVLSVAAAAAAILLAVRVAPPRPVRPPDAAGSGGALAAAEISRLRAEIARLDREAAVLAAVVRRTDDLRRRPAAASPLRRALVDAQMEAGARYNAAAYLVVLQAGRLEATSAAIAAVAYRDVIEIFPDTPWAAEARQKLAALGATEGGSS